MFIDLGVRGEVLLKLVSYWPLGGWRLPGNGVLPSQLEEALSGWMSVSVPADGTSSCDWAIVGALPRATAAPKMNTNNMLDMDSSL